MDSGGGIIRECDDFSASRPATLSGPRRCGFYHILADRRQKGLKPAIISMECRRDCWAALTSQVPSPGILQPSSRQCVPRAPHRKRFCPDRKSRTYRRLQLVRAPARSDFLVHIVRGHRRTSTCRLLRILQLFLAEIFYSSFCEIPEEH